MSSRRRLSGLRQWIQTFGLEFWLPLPLLAIAFWLGGEVLTSQVLSKPYGTENKLQADTQLEIHFSVSVAVIHVTIDQPEGISLVEVKTTDSVLKKLEFEFPVTDASQLESLIAQELRLSITDVRNLVRYEIVN